MLLIVRDRQAVVRYRRVVFNYLRHCCNAQQCATMRKRRRSLSDLSWPAAGQFDVPEDDEIERKKSGYRFNLFEESRTETVLDRGITLYTIILRGIERHDLWQPKR